MMPILQQFLSEARELLQSITGKLLELEKAPGDPELISHLFRSVHTLKGNSGLFDFPEISRVLHATEDLLSVVREGRLAFSQELADRLLGAMDFVALLLAEIQAGAGGGAADAQTAVRLAGSLRELIVIAPAMADTPLEPGSSGDWPAAASTLPLDAVPEVLRTAWREAARAAEPLHGIVYSPASDCFFKGEDPFHQARQTPGVVWHRVSAARPWPPLAELDPYQCALRFDLVSTAPRSALDEHFRYVPEQVAIVPLTLLLLDSAPAAGATAHDVPHAQGGEDGPHARGAEDAPHARGAEDAPPDTALLKVDQEKIDRLMSLIGEMVVAKNGLPFLAARAETVYGVRELSREIKAQYAVINRIAGEMQDAIMQVRMMPVSGVFQRFPRLVRDISRKLGKEVLLTLEGGHTEADKNIIEALAEPLVHLVRNSLDHGIETPDVRRAAGKAVEGRLLIRASQDSGRVIIDISDDGKGIDPGVIKRKAYAKGIIDQTMLERISDQDAVNLVFAAGFSTAETVSDLSGRGVGMDVVRNAVQRVNGSVTLTSEAGRGTQLRLSLPLSMTATNVIVIESNQQIFGVPMDMVLETVRIPRSAIRSIKNRQTILLRDRVLPLRSLNELLERHLPQVSNELDEMAALVVEIHGESLGIVVDDFREVVDIILKPMGGILDGVPGYCGSALLGDGSVLMVLNPKELVLWQ